MPINRPDNVEDGNEIPWYESRYTSPVADSEWYLDPSVPDNYVPVPGEEELYMVVDDSGNIIAYRNRKMQADGTWVWEDVNPDIPDNYQLIDGTENLYKITDKNGNVSYYLYIRNEDDTYCFVPTDESGTPYYDGNDADVITSNYVHEDGNIYSVYNEDGVKEGYAERKKNSDGKYVWKKTTAPEKKQTVVNCTTESVGTTENSKDKKTLFGSSENSPTVTESDGTYTVTNKSSNTVTKDGYNITYETTVYNTYDFNGNLLCTKQDGPYEVSRTKVAASETPNINLIEKSLDNEYNRVSVQVSFNTDRANEVLSKLNAERVNQGLDSLVMNTKSEAYKLACIRAADMAIYNYSSSVSPMYGTLDDMILKWKCTTSNASENVWRASIKSAAEIHSRFQAYDGSRNIRMSSTYTEVGIAIVEKNDQIYIAEIYLK